VNVSRWVGDFYEVRTCRMKVSEYWSGGGGRGAFGTCKVLE